MTWRRLRDAVDALPAGVFFVGLAPIVDLDLVLLTIARVIGVRGDYQRVADFRASATDPDASLMRSRGGGPNLGYHDHYAVDGGMARIVLAALVTPAEMMETKSPHYMV